MKQVNFEDMIPEKNYIAIVTGHEGEMFSSTVFAKKDNQGLCEYLGVHECSMCYYENGDEWIDADWLFEESNNLKIYEFPDG